MLITGNGLLLLVLGSIFFLGCATGMTKSKSISQRKETASQEWDAAQKVLGGMAGREISRTELMRVGKDIQKNEEARSAVSKIVGTNGGVRAKYSPVTGKHYSGNLEFDPETGVKLEVIEE